MVRVSTPLLAKIETSGVAQHVRVDRQSDCGFLSSPRAHLALPISVTQIRLDGTRVHAPVGKDRNQWRGAACAGGQAIRLWLSVQPSRPSSSADLGDTNTPGWYACPRPCWQR